MNPNKKANIDDIILTGYDAFALQFNETDTAIIFIVISATIADIFNVR